MTLVYFYSCIVLLLNTHLFVCSLPTYHILFLSDIFSFTKKMLYTEENERSMQAKELRNK